MVRGPYHKVVPATEFTAFFQQKIKKYCIEFQPSEASFEPVSNQYDLETVYTHESGQCLLFTLKFKMNQDRFAEDYMY